ncbi:MAG: zinc permease [Actinobacteria bacterium]|nr:zinc permease [Actinomycetota bacterium]
MRAHDRPVGQAILFGGVASAALVLGAAIGARWSLPEHLYAVLLAFAGGALISALAFELFQDAEKGGGVWLAGLGLVLGAATFVVVDARIEGLRGSAASFGLLAAVTLDGVPENLALGVSLIEGSGYALLVAIFASNFPEALGSASKMRDDGRSARFIMGVWLSTAILLAASVVFGRALLGGASGGVLAVLLGFAGGAVLASLADTVMPEAFRHGGPYVAFATVAGFLLSYVVALE